MLKVNSFYKDVAENYLFSQIARKVSDFSKLHPEERIIRLGIGDVTLPLAGAVIDTLHSAVDDMSRKETFRGYAPDLGYDFLRETISREDFAVRGCDITPDEIFVSDGAKGDVGNIQEIFSRDSIAGICDPVYPVYADSNIMAGRRIELLPCSIENGFLPEIPGPDKEVDLIYLCFPNNPTGAAIKKDQLQAWVDYANKTGAVIIYDAAYEAYISEPDMPHSVYECDGARECAIEIHSFSKNAGFTGLRLGYTVVPKNLIRQNMSLHDMWARRHSTKYNGAPYIVQKAGQAVYSEEGRKQTMEQVAYYMRNAHYIADKLTEIGCSISGGINAPYIWMKVPKPFDSWEFFDLLLEKIHVVGTPGSGFGSCGEGYFRLTAFGNYEDTVEAVDRIVELLAK